MKKRVVIISIAAILVIALGLNLFSGIGQGSFGENEELVKEPNKDQNLCDHIDINQDMYVIIA